MESLVTLNNSLNNLSSFIPSTFEGMHGLSYVDISYNELEGHLPNNSAFQEALPEALQGNKGLCGNVRSLQPCKHGSRRNHKWVFVITFTLLAAVFLLCAFFTIVFMERKKKHRDKGEKNMHEEEWFSVLNFDGKSMYEEILMATKNFDFIYCIGSGGQGSVYKANLSCGNIVAVKKLHHLWDHEKNLENGFLNEMRALTEIRHRNIVKLYGFYLHHRHSFLVYEFFERGSLAKILSKDEATEVRWRKRMNIVNSVAHALAYVTNCAPDISRRHPGDFFSTFSSVPSSSLLSSSSALPNRQMPIMDVLDQRISPPTHQEVGEVLSLVKVAFSCLNPSPQSRPAMKQVSQILSTQKLHLSKPLHVITCGELYALDPLTV
ncbi:LRR receptor-like serine/threonine-protein kinase [Pyrus ussuriensis x Pyrus communis]|uniref:non-specific serine/threonine protein kinase n=1 Tax=Pyrus ussuriensis x Pyrus communis TaxID=2448454 RepID=A0A5N5GPD8_9ROSA|nr:LRR receptor-like serine/threonine-protein kinase [Pyrus ussuriensis x Pyrus communis]